LQHTFKVCDSWVRSSAALADEEWYFRIFSWTRFLWQVSRIELRLLPTHPDRCGGLGFLMFVRFAFAPLLLAQGVQLAGVIAEQIFFGHGKLQTVSIVFLEKLPFRVSFDFCGVL
jgi:hypothetical protein